MTKGVVYARISNDHGGEGLGVERQREECQRLADSLNIEIIHVYTDNSISAYSGKERPAYQAMLAALRSGEASVVLAFNLDRLYRRMRDLEDYIDLVEQRGIRTETVLAGSFDLNTPMGRAIARNAIAFATLEVDQSKARVISAKAQAARAGKYSGGQRCFGYEKDGVTIREHEAAALREMASMLISGVSYNKIAEEMNQRGIGTATGKEWRAIKVQSVLTNKRYIGIRSHNGEAEYKAQWPAILTDDTWDQLQAAAAVRRSLYKQRGTFRRNMLIGFIFCGECGASLVSGLKQSRDKSRYDQTWRCLHYRANEANGCGKVSRLAAPIDELISDAVIYRLNSTEMQEALKKTQDNTKLTNLIQLERGQEELLNELLEDRASGLLSRSDYAKAREIAEAKLTDIRTQIAAESKRSVTGLPKALTREQWDEASIDWRRSVLSVLVDKVVVHRLPTRDMKTKYKGFFFDPSFIETQWLQ